jgi:formyltetrahydrofolate deformylase
MRERSNPERSVAIETRAKPSFRRASGVRRIELPAAEPHALDVQVQRAAAPLADPSLSMELRWRGGSATLLARCPGRQDTAAALLDAVCSSGARLSRCDQHADPESEHLFQRLVLEVPKSGGAARLLERRLEQLAQSWGMGFGIQRSECLPRVAVFVSKYDHCLHDLLLRQRAGELGGEIALIVSNHPDLEPLARHFGVDYELMPKQAASRLDAEARECALLEDRRVDLVVMARYMQILSDGFIQLWSGRVINIHHSFLPAFIGAKPYHQARQRGVKLIGATAHYATAQLDEGPIIEQDVARCSHQDGVEELIRKGRDLERLVLARAVRWHLEDRVLIHGNRTVVF